MISLSRVVCILVFAASLLAVPVWGDDLNPPSWRSQAGSTFQQWEFSQDVRTALPDAVNNPYGMPVLDMRPNEWAGVPEWSDYYRGRQGVYSLSGEFDVTIANTQWQNPYKDIWIQVTWWPQFVFDFNEYPIIDVLEPTGVGRMLTLIEDDAIGMDPPVWNRWHHTTWQLRIWPNPAYEKIYFRAPMYVDEVVIDTICVPEPAGVSLLAIGALALVRRR